MRRDMLYGACRTDANLSPTSPEAEIATVFPGLGEECSGCCLSRQMCLSLHSRLFLSRHGEGGVQTQAQLTKRRLVKA